MAQVQTERSKVKVRVPKRLWKSEAPEVVEWREFKLRTRLMPNGYRVTIAAIYWDGRIIFGASACAPGDFFIRPLAYHIAFGRARQAAFRSAPLSSILWDGNRSPLDNLFGIEYRGSEDERVLFGAIKTIADELYEIAARNAETMAVRETIRLLRRAHGGRFMISAVAVR